MTWALKKNRLIFRPYNSNFLLTTTPLFRHEIWWTKWVCFHKKEGFLEAFLFTYHVTIFCCEACSLNVKQYIVYSDAIVILRECSEIIIYLWILKQPFIVNIYFNLQSLLLSWYYLCLYFVFSAMFEIFTSHVVTKKTYYCLYLHI